MLRAIIGVIVGYAVWTAIWLTGGLTVFGEASKAAGEGERVESIGTLAGFLVLSVVCSLAGGAVCAVISRSCKAVMVTAALLLLTGIGVQAGSWSLMPVWYHLAFLVLLVPVTVVGGGLVRRGGADGKAALS